MTRIPLVHLAHARSGDKGDTANIGLIAYEPAHYEILRREVTAERVAEHLAPLVRGPVERFELPKVHALNFLLHQALGGGGTLSLRTDNQGKVLSTALLRMQVDVPDEVALAAAGRGRVPRGWAPDGTTPGGTR
jgi:hypothetical protein